MEQGEDGSARAGRCPDPLLPSLSNQSGNSVMPAILHEDAREPRKPISVASVTARREGPRGD